jgi:AcrR family transcriptional regulator
MRTRTRILVATAALASGGQSPTVEQAADAAGVSRRTAYRYFPSQTKLLAEAVLEGLREPMEAMIATLPGEARAEDVQTRVAALIDRMQSMMLTHEHLLRIMVHQTVLESGSARLPRRGTRRIDWIESALGKLDEQVSASARARLVSGLALCMGIEAVLVLRDIRCLSATAATGVSRWVANALIQQTLQEAQQRQSAPRKRPAGGGGFVRARSRH